MGFKSYKILFIIFIMDNILLPNILEIIENNNIESEYSVINELEDTIIDLYEKNSSSGLFKNDFLLLLKLNDNIIKKLNMKTFKLNLEIFNQNDKFKKNIDKIVITGPYIRSIFVQDKTNIKKEIYINCIKDLKYIDLIDESYNEINDLYFKNIDEFIIYIPKKTFKNQSDVILSNYNFKRVGMYINDIYVSSIFIADYIKLSDSINSDIVDPVYKTKLDIFDIYQHDNLQKNNTIFDIINKKNYEEYKKFKTTKYDIIDFDRNSKSFGINSCEYALDLYKSEHNDIIKSQLKLIILDLSSKIFLRNPCFYADMINLEEIDSDLFDILKDSKIYVNIMSDFNQKIKSINDINNLILTYYIKKDLSDEFYNFLKYKDDKNVKIDINIFNLIIQTDPKNIIINGIKNNFFSDRTKYKIILWTQNLDYFNLFSDEFNIDIATNYINDIVENCLIKSFYFLYKIDQSIINIVDSDNNNLLHNIKENGNFSDMIELILKLDDSLLFKKNNNNEIPLLKHCKNNNLKIVSYLIDSIIKNDNESLFELIDNDKNTILHYLCKNDDTLKLIKKIILIKPEIINYQNINFETPLILSAKYSQEDIIYFLKGVNGQMNICDIYGNTIYHYICQNELCIGLDIVNKENIFGYKPSDYSKISNNYYYFIN
jgi:hypothetical protein